MSDKIQIYAVRDMARGAPVMESAEVVVRKTTVRTTHPTGLAFGCRSTFKLDEVHRTPVAAAQAYVKHCIRAVSQLRVSLNEAQTELDAARELLRSVEDSAPRPMTTMCRSPG